MTAFGRSTAALILLPHHFEHLLPLCYLAQATAICLDPAVDRFIKRYFPEVRSIFVDPPQQSSDALLCEPLRSLIRSFDVVLISTLFSRKKLTHIFCTTGKHPQRIIFCPHGFSEKKQSWSAGAAFQDITLVYGDYGLDQFRSWGVNSHLERFVMVGNYRRQFHEAWEHRCNSTLDGSLPLKGSSEIILYAPTWRDRVGASSYESALRTLVQNVPTGATLVIKPHPLLKITDGQRMEIESTGNAVLLDSCLLTLPLLKRVSSYIGDMSALAYDFLPANRPMVFLNEASNAKSDHSDSMLFACGSVISSANYVCVYDALREEASGAILRSANKKRLYDYVYSPSPSEDELRQALLNYLEGPPPAFFSGSQY